MCVRVCVYVGVCVCGCPSVGVYRRATRTAAAPLLSNQYCTIVILLIQLSSLLSALIHRTSGCGRTREHHSDPQRQSGHVSRVHATVGGQVGRTGSLGLADVSRHQRRERHVCCPVCMYLHIWLSTTTWNFVGSHSNKSDRGCLFVDCIFFVYLCAVVVCGYCPT
jgi:hypothetical protein